MATEPSYPERARTLVHLGRTGTLSTHSLKYPGWPFGSVMPYAVDEAGRPILLMSGMAVHARNVAADPRASLLIAQPELQDDLLAGARLTLLGAVNSVPEERIAAVRDLYLARQPAAAAWIGFQDFSFRVLDLHAIYFVGGFGAMGWITVPEYSAAEPDPLADVAVDLVYYVNLHYGPSIAKLASAAAGERVGSAHVTAVDRLGFQVRYRSGEHSADLRVPFATEIREAEAAKDAFRSMRGQ